MLTNGVGVVLDDAVDTGTAFTGVVTGKLPVVDFGIACGFPFSL